jgi:hypothetical protein
MRSGSAGIIRWTSMRVSLLVMRSSCHRVVGGREELGEPLGGKIRDRGLDESMTVFVEDFGHGVT